MGLTVLAGQLMGRFIRRHRPVVLLASGLWAAILGALPTLILPAVTSPALAQQADLYTASGITVDLTGDIATLRDQALVQGQRLALQKVIANIAPSDRAANVALPDDTTIGSWVQDFEIEDEKSSATHYIGRFTFRFMAQPIRDFLARNGVDFAQGPAKRMLVVPIFTDETGTSVLWGANNQWLHAWAARPAAGGLVPIVAPNGDLEDSNMISATQALAGDRARLGQLAQRYGAGDILVTEAKLSPAGQDGQRGLNITATQYGIGGTRTYQDTLSGPADNVDQLLAQGADRVATQINQSWKSENLLNPNQQNQMTIDVPVANLKQWVEIKKRLAGVNLLRSVRLVSLKPSLAVIDVSYIGDAAQFSRMLAQNALVLNDTGNGTGTLALAPGNATVPLPAASNTQSNETAPAESAPDAAPSEQPAVSDQPAVPQ
jgi:hypothetical protein